jgi:hypothetical protein
MFSLFWTQKYISTQESLNRKKSAFYTLILDSFAMPIQIQLLEIKTQKKF